MKRQRGVVLLGARPVRWLGGALLAAGLLLPWLILAWRAAEPPQSQAGGGPVALRPAMVVLPAGSFVMGSPPDEAGRSVRRGALRPIARTGWGQDKGDRSCIVTLSYLSSLRGRRMQQ